MSNKLTNKSCAKMIQFKTECNLVTLPFGTFKTVSFRPDPIVDAEASIAHYKNLSKKTIKLCLLLDCSGSMNPNIHILINTACAAVDLLENGSHLRAIIFDETSHEIISEIEVNSLTRDIIKIGLRSKVASKNKRTNIESALKCAFEQPDWQVLFLTDGLSNVGNLKSSKDLIAMSRLHANYWTQKYFCLGLQVTVDGLNGDLLKSLAIDTNGVFILAHDAESIRSFVGNILNDHYMTEFTNTLIDTEGLLITEFSKKGLSLRLDKETTIMYKIEDHHSANVAMKAIDRNGLAVNLKVDSTSKSETVFSIASVYAGHLISQKDDNGLRDLKKNIYELIRNPEENDDSYWPIINAIEAYLVNPYDEALNSSNAYRMCSAGGCDETSQTVQVLRSVSATASQDPY